MMIKSRIAKKLDLKSFMKKDCQVILLLQLCYQNSIKIINIKDKLNYICCFIHVILLNMSDVRKCYKIVKKNQNFVFSCQI